MMTYPRIPDPPAARPDDTAARYGLQLYQYAMAHGSAQLSNEQLQLASAAAIRVVSVPRGTYSDPVYAQLTRTADMLAHVLRARQRDQAAADAIHLITTPGGADPEGPMAPLIDVPIVRPPAPGYARQDDGIAF